MAVINIYIKRAMSQQLFKAYWHALKINFSDIPMGNFYHRFHRKDINRVFTIPCPVPTEAEKFKSIRAQVGVKEEFVCPQCPHQKNCDFAFKQGDGGNMQTLPAKDLGFLLNAITEMDLSVNDQRHYWLGAMRLVDTFHQVIKDYKENGNEINGEFLQKVSEDIPPKVNIPPPKSPSQKAPHSTKYSQDRPSSADKYNKRADFLQDLDEDPQPPQKRQQKGRQDFSRDRQDFSRDRQEPSRERQDYGRDRQNSYQGRQDSYKDRQGSNRDRQDSYRGRQDGYKNRQDSNRDRFEQGSERGAYEEGREKKQRHDKLPGKHYQPAGEQRERQQEYKPRNLEQRGGKKHDKTRNSEFAEKQREERSSRAQAEDWDEEMVEEKQARRVNEEGQRQPARRQEQSGRVVPNREPRRQEEKSEEPEPSREEGNGGRRVKKNMKFTIAQ